MTRRDCLIAIGVAAIWGINFVVSAILLRDLPPFLLTAIRFGLVAFPAVLFVPRPSSGWRATVLVGFFIGCVQFGMMFWAIYLGMPAGLASLLIQFVTIFTLALGVVVLHERPSRLQVLGVLVGLLGLAVIGIGRIGGGAAQLVPFFMMLIAALGRGEHHGPQVRREVRPINLGLVVAGSGAADARCLVRRRRPRGDG